jgi:hypothetical protein
MIFAETRPQSDIIHILVICPFNHNSNVRICVVTLAFTVPTISSVSRGRVPRVTHLLTVCSSLCQRQAVQMRVPRAVVVLPLTCY